MEVYNFSSKCSILITVILITAILITAHLEEAPQFFLRKKGRAESDQMELPEDVPSAPLLEL